MTETQQIIQDSNRWYQKTWLPAAAFTYLAICIFDFILMPTLVSIQSTHIENEVLRAINKSYIATQDTNAYVQSLEKLKTMHIEWKPLTLENGGLIHLAFGALLTGGVWTRGQEKKALVEKINLDKK